MTDADKMALLTGILAAIRDWPANSNSEPDDMGAALDSIHVVAKGALAGLESLWVVTMRYIDEFMTTPYVVTAPTALEAVRAAVAEYREAHGADNFTEAEDAANLIVTGVYPGFIGFNALTGKGLPFRGDEGGLASELIEIADTRAA